MHRFILLLGLLLHPNLLAAPKPLPVNAGDHVVLIGNTFAVRMGLFGHFETFLHCKFPKHKLVVRNLGWPADEVMRSRGGVLMPRPTGFGNLHEQLASQKADLIFACFGLNESFAGDARLEKFKRDLDTFLTELQIGKFNGKTPPRIVLVSPIAAERGGENRNANLAAYTSLMAKVATTRGIRFTDLFSPTRKWMTENKGQTLTFNGIHLTEYGDRIVSRMLAEALELSGASTKAEPAGEKLRRMVYEKNHHFFIRWRGPNAEYIHGRRNRLPGAIKLPQEMA